MAGPWEQYQQPAASQTPAGPWTQYAQPVTDLPAVQALPPDFSDVSPRVDTTEGQPDSSTVRDIKMGARSVLQGAGGLFGALGGDAFNHYVVDPIREKFSSPTLSGLITGQKGAAPSPSYRDAAGSLADRLGLPRPQTAQERVMGDVGEALTGTGLTMGVGGLLNAGRNLASTAAPTARNTLGNFLTAQPKLQAVSTATGAGAASATREAGGSEGQQLAAGLIGGLSPSVVHATNSAAVRGLLRGGEGGRKTVADNISTFKAAGDSPTAGQASGNRRARALETAVASLPGGAGVMAAKASQQAKNVGDRLDDLAGTLSPGGGGLSPQTAGESVQQGAKTFSDNVRLNRRALYWQADKLIPETTPVSVSSTQKALADLTTPTAGAEATTGSLISPRIQQLAQNLESDLAGGNGAIPYSALKEIRSRIGEELSDFALSSDRPTAQYKKLYGALSQDMEKAARAQGPHAERAYRYANNYYKITERRLEQLDRVIHKAGGPEYVYNALYAGAKQGSTTIDAVMRSLPKESQKDFVAATIRQMGRAKPGQQNAATDAFSMETFLTNWGSISKEARAAIFNRQGTQFSSAMDQIAKTAENLREGSKVFANPSNTASKQVLLAGGGAAASTVFGALLRGQVGYAAAAAAAPFAAAGAANLVAKKLTNPEFVNWLAMTTHMPAGAIPAQVNVLRGMAEQHKDPEYEEIADLLQESQSDANK